MIARALLLAAALLALAASPALAKGGFDDVFKDYSGDGRIDPCKHSAAELQKARGDIPPDIEQYAPDFPEALDQAIEARAKGRCSKQAAQTTTPTTNAAPAAPAAPGGGGGSSPAPAPAAAANPGEPPAPTAASVPAGAPKDDAIEKAASSGGGSDVPAPLIALGVLAALAALCGLAYALARWRAWEPDWALRARHAGAEASWRASNTWAEFSDWLRLGQR